MNTTLVAICITAMKLGVAGAGIIVTSLGISQYHDFTKKKKSKGGDLNGVNGESSSENIRHRVRGL